MTLVGVHVNILTPAAERTLRNGRPKLVKTLQHNLPWDALKAECGIEFLLGREWLDPDANLDPTPEAAAERLFAAMLPAMQRWRGVYDAWETPWNERFQRPWERLADHAKACRRFCELAQGERIAVAVGNFGVHNPEPEEMALFAPALELAAYLSLHEYWLPNQFNWGFWAGKWRRLVETLPPESRRPVLITECGVDGQLEGKPLGTGWRSYGMSAEWYVAGLDEYRRSLDDRVAGMAVFCCGTADETWLPLDVAGEEKVGGWLLEVNAAPAVPPPPEPPTPDPPAAQVDHPTATWLASPNHESRGGRKVVAIVVHIAQGTMGGMDSEFANPATEKSAHYAVSKAGAIRQYVREAEASWAAGIKFGSGYDAYKSDLQTAWIAALWQAKTNPNLIVVNVELEGKSGEAVPEAQYQALLGLLWGVGKRHGIPLTGEFVVGHYRLDAVNRSYDPGPAFPWIRLLSDLAGIATPSERPIDRARILGQLDGLFRAHTDLGNLGELLQSRTLLDIDHAIWEAFRVIKDEIA